jgi:hypothetical protein
MVPFHSGLDTFAVNNSTSSKFHGTEEVVRSIPIRPPNSKAYAATTPSEAGEAMVLRVVATPIKVS